MADETINSYDLLKQYSNNGTHFSSGFYTGDKHLPGANFASSMGIPSSTLLPYSFCPTYDPDAWAVGAYPNLDPGQTQYIKLNNITQPVGYAQYLQKVRIGDSYAIRMDYARVITVKSSQSFNVSVSGYDVHMQKVNMSGTSSNIAGQNMWVAPRAVAYTTSISVTNTSSTSSGFNIVLDKWIEIPYFCFNGNSTGGNLLAGCTSQIVDFRISRRDVTGSMDYSLNAFFAGRLANIIPNDYSLPPIPVQVPVGQNYVSPLTLTTGTPRLLLNLNYATSQPSLTNYFKFDQKEFYTMYFSNLGIFEGMNPAYGYNFTEKESVLGYTNYSDSNWTGWKG